MKKLFPQTIAAQLIALLVLALLIGQVVNLFLIVGERRVQARVQQFKQVIEVVVERAKTLPDFEDLDLPYTLRQNGQLRGAYFLSRNNRALTQRDTKRLPKYERRYKNKLEEAGIVPLNIHVALLSKRPRGGPPPRPPRDRRLGPPNGRRDGPPDRPDQFRPRRRPDPTGPPAPGMQEIILSAELAPGVWYNAMVPHYSLEAITSRFLLATGIIMTLTLLAAWFFARRITKPLSKLAAAADLLGRGHTDIILDETGPTDLREATSAFNKMQKRLTRTLESQRTMLRAIGHDLRTPITSLRIRAENIPKTAGRDKFISTLNDMTEMTEEILDWSKDVSGLEEIAPVDLNAFLASLTDNYQDQGADVTFTETNKTILNIRRISLKRALTNLIDNAVKYGKCARVSVEQTNNRINIHIDDDGPGIPPGKLDDVLKPFVRLEASRNKDTGGIGLGLSIADSIILSAGGKLTLKNQSRGGLRCTVQLPIG